MKAQLEALQMEVDEIRRHLNLPSAVSAAAVAATGKALAAKEQSVTSAVPTGTGRLPNGAAHMSQVIVELSMNNHFCWKIRIFFVALA